METTVELGHVIPWLIFTAVMCFFLGTVAYAKWSRDPAAIRTEAEKDELRKEIESWGR